MRYVKLFEEFGDKLYTKISGTEANQLIYNKQQLGFHPSDRKRIDKFLNNHLWDYCQNKTTNKPWYMEKNYASSVIELVPSDKDRNFTRKCTISLFEDEYYLVRMNSIVSITDLNLWFKCDQFEGLMEFISDLIYGELLTFKDYNH